MDVTLPKKELLRLFGRTQGVAEKKSTMPILSNVLIQAENGLLRTSATDLFMAVSASVAAEVTTIGSLALPAKELIERLKAMPEGLVQIRSTDGTTTQIKAIGAKREFRLRGMSSADFPALPKPDAKAHEMSISAASFADLIAHTYFSISSDETRPHLNGALFEWDGDCIRMVSTDGHRLTKYEMNVGDEGKANFSLLIPLKGVVELRRLCEEFKSEKEKNTFKLLTGGPNVFFMREDLMLAIKLVDAQFPPYQRVIPEKTTNHVHINRTTLIDALRAMSIAASERTGSVKLSLKKGVIHITSENPDSGDGFDELPVDYAGNDLTIGFNVRYILDVLNSLDEEEIILGVSGELDPVVIQPASERKFLGIVMPMRI